MVVTGHNDKSEQCVSFIGKVKEGVLDDSCLAFIFKVPNGTLVIQQFIDETEHKFVFPAFPLVLAKSRWSRTLFQFTPILPDPGQSSR